MKKNAVSVLLLINVILFIIQISFRGFTESFMLVSADIWVRPWIIITSMFLHGGVAHLFFNMYALYLFGTLVERSIGTKKFLLVYFTAGILAAMLPQYSAALGASGAIMGIIGLVIMLFPDMKILFFFAIPMSMRTAGIIFAAIEVFGLLVPVHTGIAHYAHLVGLAVGLIFGYYIMKKKGGVRRFYAGVPSQSDFDRHYGH